MAKDKEKPKTVIVVCVDRDNDLGRKTGIEGPVIGRARNVNAAKALALKDPTESDANTMFAAVKKLEEIKNEFPKIEVVTLTGKGKLGFASDKRINEQLDLLTEKFNIQGFVLVTDGMEDDQVIPLLQSRAKIISKETVIIKQAKEVESIYYTIKEALRDPGIARTVFGIPGLILTVYAITLMIGAETQFFQGISLILGIYLLLKGFGIESRVLKGITHLTEGISVQRVSFPFYMASGFVFLFGVYTGLANYNPTSDSFTSIISAVQTTYFFAITSVLFMVLARAIDAVHAKKAYLLRKYVMYFIGITVLWLIIDSATLVFLRQTDLNFFLITVLISFIALLIAFKATQVIDIRGQVTQLLLNLPVYNNQGEWLGKIKQVRENENMIYYKPSGKKEFISIKKENFIVRKSRIIIQ